MYANLFISERAVRRRQRRGRPAAAQGGQEGQEPPPPLQEEGQKVQQQRRRRQPSRQWRKEEALHALRAPEVRMRSDKMRSSLSFTVISLSDTLLILKVRGRGQREDRGRFRRFVGPQLRRGGGRRGERGGGGGGGSGGGRDRTRQQDHQERQGLEAREGDNPGWGSAGKLSNLSLF